MRIDLSMKLKTDNQAGRNDWMIFAFGATAILAGALALAKGASFFRGPARVEDAVAHALNQNNREPNDVQRYLKAAQEVAAALKEKNLFIIKPPKQHPVKQVDGILGNEALIGDKWYKAGAKIGDAVLLAVEPTQVRIEWDGQEKTFPPLAAASEGKGSQQGPPETRGPAGKPGASPAKPGSGPKTVKVKGQGRPCRPAVTHWVGWAWSCRPGSRRSCSSIGTRCRQKNRRRPGANGTVCRRKKKKEPLRP